MKKRLVILMLAMLTVFIGAEAGVKGAAVGAGVGAAVGHIVGGNDEAWIGAALGAAGGSLIESNKKFEKEIEAENTAKQSYKSQSVVAAEPEEPLVISTSKKEDTWGVRSEEEIKEKMAMEKENYESWKASF